MKNLAFFLFMMIAIALGMAPFVDGALFQSIFTQRIEMLAKKISPDNHLQIKVSEYHLGWMKSNALVTFTLMPESQLDTDKQDSAPIVIKYAVTIYHGPLVIIDKQPVLAAAYMKSKIIWPEKLLKDLKAENQDMMDVTLKSIVPLDCNSMHTTIDIPPLVLKDKLKWAGASVESNIIFTNMNRIQINSKMNIGAMMLSSPEQNKQTQLVIDPIDITNNTEQQTSYLWNGTSDLSTAGIALILPDNTRFLANQLAYNVTYGEKDKFYSLVMKWSLGNLQLPADLLISNISKSSFTFSINNLNASALNDFRSNYDKLMNEKNINKLPGYLIKLLTPSSKLNMSFGTDTNVGAFNAQADVSLESLQNDIFDMIKNLNVELNLRISGTLLSKIVADTSEHHVMVNNDGLATSEGAATVEPKPEAPATMETKPVETVSTHNTNPDMIKKVIDDYVAQGYLVQDGKDYTISVIKKGSALTVSNKDQSALLMFFNDALAKLKNEIGPLPLPETNVEAKPEPVPEVKSETKPEPEPAPEVKSETKPEPAPEVKSETKPEPAPMSATSPTPNATPMSATSPTGAATPAAKTEPAATDAERNTYYNQLVEAANSYTEAIDGCLKTIYSLTGCDAGTNNIPTGITEPKGAIAKLTVKDGVITVTPVEKYGIVTEDTYILTPVISPKGKLVWSSSGAGVTKGYAY